MTHKVLCRTFIGPLLADIEYGFFCSSCVLFFFFFFLNFLHLGIRSFATNHYHRTTMSSSELQDSFRVLGLSTSATDVEIRKAYRKLSLRYHPDKASKDVDPILAADRFHKINFAYEMLMDPAARARIQQQLAEDAAKRERQDKYEGKRRQMADDLERSEQEAISKKGDLLRRTRERQEIIANLKEEARKMVLRKQNELRAASETTTGKQHTAQRGPDLQPLDKTVRVRLPSSQFPQLTGMDTFVQPTAPLSTPLAIALTAQFGPLETLQFQLPSAGKKVKREITALASFVHLKDAWQAVVTGSEMRGTDHLEDAYIGWAAFEERRGNKIYNEPKRVQWYVARGITHPKDLAREETPHSPSTRRKLTAEYEQATLQRLIDAQQGREQSL